MARDTSGEGTRDMGPRRANVVSRLRKVEGQARGIARMVEEGRDCEAVLTQILAARVALDRVAGQVAAGFVGECIESDSSAVAAVRISRVVGLLARTG